MTPRVLLALRLLTPVRLLLDRADRAFAELLDLLRLVGAARASWSPKVAEGPAVCDPDDEPPWTPPTHFATREGTACGIAWSPGRVFDWVATREPFFADPDRCPACVRVLTPEVDS